jgi:hypothetical protein
LARARPVKPARLYDTEAGNAVEQPTDS